MTTGLTTDQLHFFKSFGYVVLRQFFAAHYRDQLIRDLDTAIAAQYPPERNNGTERLWTRMTDESTPFTAALMEDPLFLIPAQQICGDDVLGIGVDINRYVGPTGWHPDTGDENQIACKYIFYLDPVDVDTGALRVIPGSHLLRGAERDAFAKAVSQTPLTDVPCQAVATEPGDVIIFDIRTWHASHGGSNNRRALNLDYFANPQTPEQIESIRRLGLGHAGSIKGFGHRRQYNYSRNWLDNPNVSPARQRWIDRLEEIGYFDQPGVGEPAAS